HANRFDPRVERAGIKREQSALAPADDPDRQMLDRVRPNFRKPVNAGEDFLDFISNQAATEFKRGAVKKLPATDASAAQMRPATAINDRRNQHATAALRQPARVLRFGWN